MEFCLTTLYYHCVFDHQVTSSTSLPPQYMLRKKFYGGKE